MKNQRDVQPRLSRRSFAQSLAKSSLVAGVGVWTGARVALADEPGASCCDAMPKLTGTLHVDDSTRRAYARDYGQIVHEQPQAVVRPGSVDDVVEVVRYARRNRLRIAARGHGHQPFGQAQVSGGIVIDMQSFQSVHSVEDDHVAVDAGADWAAVLKASLDRARTPPVLPAHLGLTVGGTLSIGGLGIATLHRGAQVDHVRELQVVTGEGLVVTCSEREQRELFEAVLAGQGQCAIITRAVLGLVPARPMLREYVLPYAGLSALLQDQQAVLHDGRFDGAVATIVPSPTGWMYMLQAVRHFTPPELPDDAAATAGLHHVAGSEQTRDVGYLEHAGASPPFDPVKSHADLGLLIPGPAAARFIGDLLPRLTANDLGQAKAMRVFTWNRNLFSRPLFRAPDADTCVYLALLRAETTDRDEVDRMLAGNRKLFEHNRDLGGTLYPYSALELTRRDWRQHYRGAWPALIAAKRRHDPDNVFASGPDLAGGRSRTAAAHDR